ncbi:MAG: hypothetical protein J5639_00910 [Bacteroidales bacterium]|nr:hypothetical protein [Bacteroidales bacterium]
MKKILMTLAALLLAGSLYAQTGDDNHFDERHFQLTTMLRYDWYNWNPGQMSATVSIGGRRNRENYWGFQTGLLKLNGTMQYGIPLLIDYTHYYPMGAAGKHSVYFGTDIGYMWIFRGQSSIFLSEKLGFDFDLGGQLPHLMVGIQANLWGVGATVGFTF